MVPRRAVRVVLIPNAVPDGVPRRYFLSLPPRIEIRVICAPAAFLGSGSRFSGSLSGIEPRFPVTRRHHGGPLPHRRRLIGQKLVRSVAGSGPAILPIAVIRLSGGTPAAPGGATGGGPASVPRSGECARRLAPPGTRHVLALELLRLSEYERDRVDRDWCNEPSAASAVRGRVLGHAWLSLGDERTTTVRKSEAKRS